MSNMPKGKQQMPESDTESEEGPMHGIDPKMLERFTDPNYSAKFVAGLPEKVRNRVRGLQGLQKQYNDLYAEYTKELAALDKKYEAEYKPFLDYRREIIQGEKEPTEEEVQAGFPEEHKGHVSLTEGERSDVKGVPAFWLRAMKNDRTLSDMITERDEECLAHLVDIRCTLCDNPNDGFTLQFAFGANEFFEETVLTKHYALENDDGELILQKATGCDITWKKGKNLTVEEKRKKQRSKKTKEIRYITTSEPCDSFFNFFKPPQPGDEDEDEGEEEDYDAADLVEMDYEAGQIIRERIIMRAVDYFTGEADSGSDDDDDYDEEDEEEEEEEEEVPAPRGGRGHGHGPQRGGRGGPSVSGGKGGQQDCKQQ